MKTNRCARCAHWKHTEATDTVFFGECQRLSIVSEANLMQDDPPGIYGERIVMHASFGCVVWIEKVLEVVLDNDAEKAQDNDPDHQFEGDAEELHSLGTAVVEPDHDHAHGHDSTADEDLCQRVVHCCFTEYLWEQVLLNGRRAQ